MPSLLRLRASTAGALFSGAGAGSGKVSALGLAVVLTGVFVPILDFFIVNVALPSIAAGLHEGGGILELVVAAYAVALGAAAVLGQLLGGCLIALNIAGLSWRLCLLVNVPVGLIAAPAAAWLIPAPETTTRTRFDLVGAALLGAGLGGIAFGLTEGRATRGPAWSFASIGFGLLALIMLGGYERMLAARAGEPLLPLAVISDRGSRRGAGCIFAFYCGMSSFFLVLALYLQTGQGLSALRSGIVFTPLGAGFFIASFAAPPLITRFGRRTLITGCGILVLAYAADAALLMARPAHALSALLTAAGLLRVSPGVDARPA